MRSLARYALANTVSRAMYSGLLTRQDFEELTRAASFADLWAALEKTPYGHWLARPAKHDAFEVERQLHQASALRFRRLLRTLRGKPLELGAVLLSRWDLDALEIVLRRWHGRQERRGAPQFYPTFAHIIPFSRILEAENLAEVAAALKHTSYAEPILSQVQTYHERHSIAFVEAALEQDFYRRLLEAVRALGGDDADAAKAIISAEIDLRNLATLGRLLQYGPAAPNYAEFLIAGSSTLSRRLRRPDAPPEFFGEMFSAHSTNLGATGAAGLPSLEAIALLERSGDEWGARLARKALAGFPFRFTCVLAFYVFIRLELRNVREIFAAKSLGLDAEATLSRLRGLN